LILSVSVTQKTDGTDGWTLHRYVDFAMLTVRAVSTMYNIIYCADSIVDLLRLETTVDKEELSNYEPVSNLSLISKIIESVVKSRVMDHLTSNSLLSSHQSAYCKHHSTKTALLYIDNHLVSAVG